MPQRLQAVTLMGPLESKRVGRLSVMVPGNDTQMRIVVRCPIATCAEPFGGLVTFVVAAIAGKREMPDPAPCIECGVMVRLTEKNLQEAQPD